MSDVTLTFPDGASRTVKSGTTGLEVAKSISPSLAKRTVAMSLDGKLADLADPIAADAKIKFISRTDPEALELIRHDAAHVMAEAVQSLWPKTQVTIGPVIENGFYYDFAKQDPFHPDDLAKIEKRMHEIVAEERAVHEGILEPQEGQGLLQGARRELQGRAGRRDPRGRGPQNLQAGRMARPLPRPAHGVHGPGRQGVQAAEDRGRLLARRSQQADAAAPLRHGVGDGSGACRVPAPARGGREARPPQARARDGPLPFPGGGAGLGVLAPERLDAVPDAHRLHAAQAQCRRLSRGQFSRHDGEAFLGALRPLGELPRDDVRHGAARRARVLLQADELPRPRADLQARPEELPRPAPEARRVRQGAPLRAVGRHARASARAPLHAGRRPHLHHRGPARGAVPGGERPPALDLRGLRLQGHRREAVDAAGEARRLGRAVGPRRGRDGQGAGRDREARQGPHQDVDQPGRGRVLRPEVRVRA